MSLEQDIFNQLKLLVPELSTPNFGYARFRCGGMMDVTIERLVKDGARIDMAISSYWRHETGDMMADPDIGIEVDLASGTVTPTHFQNDGLHLFQRYDGPSKHRTDCAAFLKTWLAQIARDYTRDANKQAVAS